MPVVVSRAGFVCKDLGIKVATLEVMIEVSISEVITAVGVVWLLVMVSQLLVVIVVVTRIALVEM